MIWVSGLVQKTCFACLESTRKVSLLFRKYLRNFFREPSQHHMDCCSSCGVFLNTLPMSWQWRSLFCVEIWDQRVMSRRGNMGWTNWSWPQLCCFAGMVLCQEHSGLRQENKGSWHCVRCAVPLVQEGLSLRRFQWADSAVKGSPGS